MEKAINMPFHLTIEGNTVSFISSKELSEEIKMCILTDSDACKNYEQNEGEANLIDTTITFNNELSASDFMKINSVNKIFKREFQKMRDKSMW